MRGTWICEEISHRGNGARPLLAGAAGELRRMGKAACSGPVLFPVCCPRGRIPQGLWGAATCGMAGGFPGSVSTCWGGGKGMGHGGSRIGRQFSHRAMKGWQVDTVSIIDSSKHIF